MPSAALLVPSQDSALRVEKDHASETTGDALPALQLAIVSTRAGFDALEADWSELHARAGRSHQLFLSFNWLWHWCNHYLEDGGRKAPELHILTARRDGRLVAVWPLVKARAGGLTVLSWMGDPVSQYGDVLVDDIPDAEIVLRQCWRYLARTSKGDLFRLRKVREDAAIAPLLASFGGMITESLVAPYLDLASAQDFSQYEQRYSGSARRNRRRLARRLDEQGKITFEEHFGGNEVRELIHLAVDLKRKWLAARGLVSKAFADDRFARFFADVAAAEVHPAGCRVAVLKTAGKPIAMEVAIGFKKRTALHVIVFDLDYEKSGAGVLLLEQSIRNAANAGETCYDLLAPGDSYKLDWADGTVAVQDWAAPLSVKGWLYARGYLGLARNGAKWAMGKLPEAMRRKLADKVSRAMAAKSD